MIELAQTLVLNQDVLNDLSNGQKSVFIYEWLCFLNKVLCATEKVGFDRNSVLFTDFIRRMIFEIVNYK